MWRVEARKTAGCPGVISGLVRVARTNKCSFGCRVYSLAESVRCKEVQIATEALGPLNLQTVVVTPGVITNSGVRREGAIWPPLVRPRNTKAVFKISQRNRYRALSGRRHTGETRARAYDICSRPQYLTSNIKGPGIARGATSCGIQYRWSVVWMVSNQYSGRVIDR